MASGWRDQFLCPSSCRLFFCMRAVTVSRRGLIERSHVGRSVSTLRSQQEYQNENCGHSEAKRVRNDAQRHSHDREHLSICPDSTSNAAFSSSLLAAASAPLAQHSRQGGRPVSQASTS